MQIEGHEPILLARCSEFAMIPGVGRQNYCSQTDDDSGWTEAEPLDLVADYQHSLPCKERLPAYGGPKPKKPVQPTDEWTPFSPAPPMII
jgi:hypothetical protein